MAQAACTNPSSGLSLFDIAIYMTSALSSLMEHSFSPQHMDWYMATSKVPMQAGYSGLMLMMQTFVKQMAHQPALLSF